MKRRLALLLVPLVAAILAACGPADAPNTSTAATNTGVVVDGSTVKCTDDGIVVDAGGAKKWSLEKALASRDLCGLFLTTEINDAIGEITRAPDLGNEGVEGCIKVSDSAQLKVYVGATQYAPTKYNDPMSPMGKEDSPCANLEGVVAYGIYTVTAICRRDDVSYTVEVTTTRDDPHKLAPEVKILVRAMIARVEP